MGFTEFLFDFNNSYNGKILCLTLVFFKQYTGQVYRLLLLTFLLKPTEKNKSLLNKGHPIEPF